MKICSVGQADRALYFFSKFRIPPSEFSLRVQNSYLIPTSLRGVGPCDPYGPEAALRFPNSNMVGVAQLVEPQVVALVVVGSSPITHPIYKFKNRAGMSARLFASD